MLNLDYLYPMRNNLYLLPYWVVKILHKNELLIADCLNFVKLRPLLSMNDLASIEAMQSFSDELFGSKDIINNSILYEWYSTVSGDPELTKVIQQVEVLSRDPNIKETLKARFNPETVTQESSPFKVIALDTKAIAVVLYPGAFTGEMYERQFQTIRALLKQLYVYEHPTNVARTPLYRRYLELLSVRKP